MPKAKPQAEQTEIPQKKDYRFHNYCPCCGAQVKGKGAAKHDDECPYRQ